MSAALAPAVAWPARGARGEATAALLLAALAGALVAGRLETGIACAAVAVGLAVWLRAHAPSRGWWRALAIGGVLAWGLNLYLTPGEALPWPQILGHAATREGARLGTLLMLRMTGAFGAVLGLTVVWPGERAADRFAGVLRPLARLGVPVAEARVMLGLALRFAPLLRAEAQRIARVQRLRAGREPRGPRERLTRLRATVVPTLTAALERADRVALALEARHYRVRPLTVERRPWDATRIVATVAGVVLFAGAALWRLRT